MFLSVFKCIKVYKNTFIHCLSSLLRPTSLLYFSFCIAQKFCNYLAQLLIYLRIYGFNEFTNYNDYFLIRKFVKSVNS
jgi:hypothetical protein